VRGIPVWPAGAAALSKSRIVKSEFFIERCRGREAADLLLKYHYLKDISKGFRSGVNIGLYRGNKDFVLLPSMEGVCIFTGLPVPEICVGAFGIERTDQDGLFELSRLCIHPKIQSNEHNLASWFVAKSIKELRRIRKVRAIISYADATFHNGTIYAASNFIYCGLTEKSYDYLDASGKILSRGSSKYGRKERTRKHRFIKLFDKSLVLKWPVIKWKGNQHAHN